MKLGTYVEFIMRELASQVQKDDEIEFEVPVIVTEGSPMSFGDPTEKRQSEMAQFDVPCGEIAKIRFTCKQRFMA